MRDFVVAQQVITIREVKAEDLKSVMSIQYKCFKDPYPLSLIRRLHIMHPDGFIVADVGGIVAGYLIGVIRWSNIGHVLAIAVEPAFQRQRLGTLLMNYIIDLFRKKGVKLVRLEVRKSNLGAQQFYKKLGFLERGEMPFYYEDGESAIAMELPLE
ncbi:MAG: ribosomal protein S18-alanine N-acetyltransferase [Candidatus Hadarchaeum sp.]|uniref:ribosomal protein S18-alanine N-acetyltransferase n=1 Tax=Candidatus Hadarchaeum sp. TaxID=2883567 RepID=UPI003D0DDD36